MCSYQCVLVKNFPNIKIIMSKSNCANKIGDVIVYDDISLIACLGNNTTSDCDFCYFSNHPGCADVNCFSAPDLKYSMNGLYYKRVD